jgi:hypothetical protein
LGEETGKDRDRYFASLISSINKGSIACIVAILILVFLLLNTGLFRVESIRGVTERIGASEIGK